MAQTELKLLTIEEWIRKSTVAPLSQRIVLGSVTFITFFLFLLFLYEQISWDQKLKTWDKVPCTILFNGKTMQGSGRNRKKVASVKYSYNYKGRSYQGNRIVYDSDIFPQWVKVGDKRTIIVNPLAPRESAVVFTWKGYWFLLRYTSGFFMFAGSLFFGGLFLYSMKKHPPCLPENLLAYLHSFTPEKINALPILKLPRYVKSNLYMDFPAEEVEEDVLLIKGKKGITGLVIILFFILFFSVSAYFLHNPVIYIYTIFFFFLIFLHFNFPAVLVMDFRRKCFYRCKKYSPEKMPDVKKISFDEVDFLSLQTLPGTDEYLLCAVELNGMMSPLFKIRGKKLSTYGEILVVIAEKMGNLPLLLR